MVYPHIPSKNCACHLPLTTPEWSLKESEGTKEDRGCVTFHICPRSPLGDGCKACHPKSASEQWPIPEV